MAGNWVEGPFWFKGNLVGIAANMVFVWRADNPNGGPQPLQVYPREGGKAAARPGFVYYGGHNVPTEIGAWIRSHGGWRCSGVPVSEPTTQGDQTCQAFAHVSLCHDAKSHRVAPQPIGERFLQTKGKFLHPELPTASRPAPGWAVQTSISAPNPRQVQLSLGIVRPPSEHCVALAVQINDKQSDSHTAHIHYDLIPCKALHKDTWLAAITLPHLLPGKHRIVAKVCAVGLQGWLACNESSVPLTLPQPGQ